VIKGWRRKFWKSLSAAGEYDGGVASAALKTQEGLIGFD